MSQEIERKLEKIPIINWVVGLMKSFKLPAFEGLSFYDLMEMYVLGIVKGALSTRASSISFSLFLALFPLLIFLVTLIPFIIPYVSVGNSNFDTEFLIFWNHFCHGLPVIILARYTCRSVRRKEGMSCPLQSHL